MSSPDRYAVVGHPVEHSRSPTIHAAFAAQTGEVLTYERLLAPLDGFADTVRRFAAEGARGCNVTVPFKFEALALAARATPRATLAGAANTLRFDADGWLADNTDGIGLMRDIAQGAGRPLAGQRVLLVGAGGAGAGVLGPLLEARPAQVVLANRTPQRAEELVKRHAALAQAQGVALSASGLEAPGEAFDLVINASASSLGGAAAPVPAATLRPGALAVDLMYGAAARPFLDWARAHGAEGRDGLGMLVEQAAEAFALWRGRRPETAPVLAALRASLARAA
ncbi:shikimate dehydrogenase [Ideonella alba]|uniref:Shikimate dehydrogenase (NADP(+)) n=1 Tax=Ideonella alba TaxID=2824118 RepID=A0A941BIY2_9BURK|nr:shikimate dehydrogenase [Ideonella alba]MBQ0933213.1 shikimate dehydrogenase [Ideonella alba]